jgi:hypothetical protein
VVRVLFRFPKAHIDQEQAASMCEEAKLVHKIPGKLARGTQALKIDLALNPESATT